MSTEGIAIAYFDAWQAGDRDRFRALLDDDVIWEGPTWRADDADECMAAFEQVSGTVSRLEIKRLWIDGDDALTWFEVQRSGADPKPVANWIHVERGRVSRVRATTDLLPSGASGAASE